MKNVKIRKICFSSDEMTCEAKAPRKKDYCLMDDADILPLHILIAIRKRIEHGIRVRQNRLPSQSQRD